MPLCKLRAVGVRRVDQRRQRAGRIVCGQDIHDRAEYIRRIILSNGHDPLSQRLAAVLAAHIAQDRLLPRVVHDGIELAAGEVPAADVVRDLVGGVLPDLADQDCLRIQLPQAPAQPLNEGVRQLIDHIQPEAVRAQPQPVRQNAVLVLNDIADVAFVHLIDARQRGDAPPALIDIGIVQEAEPAAIGRGRVGDGALEIRAAASDVRKHAVEHDLHAEHMSRLAKSGEVRLRTEHRIDALIVVGIVPVVGKRHKNGVEIEDLHAKPVQIRKLFPNTVQISAEEVIVEHFAMLIRQIDRQLIPALMHIIGPQLLRAVADAGLIEPVREDLIHDRAPERLRHGIALLHTAQLPEVARLHIRVISLLEEPELFVCGGDTEAVKIQLRPLQRKSAAVAFVQLAALLQGHFDLALRGAVFAQQQELHPRRAAADGDLDVHGTRLSRMQHAEGRFELGKLAVK